MDTFEWNKVIGAGLMALLVTTVIGHLGDILVQPKALEKKAYVVANVGEEKAAGAAQTAAAPAQLESIASLLAAASADTGKNVFKQCTSCHTADKGGRSGVGPNLWDVVGNKKAHTSGFSYSNAMQGAAQKGGDDAVWGYEQLNAFLANPKAYLPGTKMTFAGLRKAEDRANVIAYLRSLSDSPKPLP